jgi:hypothetical protein
VKEGDLVRYSSDFVVSEPNYLGVVVRISSSGSLIEVVWMEPPGLRQWFSPDLLEVIK